ncbi:MAG: DUF5989 family protein [Crocinitomicaceae bacterium]|nr:DUF5989 family protein [Crocinitomicaceae bacterium]
MNFLGDIWRYLKERKKFWLLPIILILLFMGILLVIGAATGLGPLVYPIF